MTYVPGGVLPYLPAGQAYRPATRSVIFADNSRIVQLIDETTKQGNGVSYSGTFMTPTLNRKDQRRLNTIAEVLLGYTSEGLTTMSISASPDGGVTTPETKIVTLSSTAGSRMRIKNVAFNTTGEDVRLIFSFDTDTLVNLFYYYPRMITRGVWNYATR